LLPSQCATALIWAVKKPFLRKKSITKRNILSTKELKIRRFLSR
jgi:hypothetical protein